MEATKTYKPVNPKPCIVCGNPTNARAVFVIDAIADEQNNQPITAWLLCPQHKALYDMGWVALIAIDQPEDVEEPSIATAVRTGTMMGIKAETLQKLIKIELPVAEDGRFAPVLFVHPSLIEMLVRMEQHIRSTTETPNTIN